MNVTAGYYRSHKGGCYEVIGISEHTEKHHITVVYRDASGKLWNRPYTMFIEPMEDGETRFQRFENQNAGKQRYLEERKRMVKQVHDKMRKGLKSK